MARFITFNGITKWTPGGITKVNAEALAPIGISANGIVALIGEADGGQPGTVGIVTIDDPAEATAAFTSGPLADAIRIAFDPSNDTRIPGGAQRVLAYKVNGGTQSTLQMYGDEPIFTDTAAAASTTTAINLTTNTSMVPNEHVGRWFQLDNTLEKRRIVSNDADTVVVSPGFGAAPAASDPVRLLESQVLLTTRDYGLFTTQTSIEFEAGTQANKFVVTVARDNLVEQSDEILGEGRIRLKYVGGPIEDTGTVQNIASDGLSFELDVASAPLLNAWAGMLMRFSNGVQREIQGNTAADPSVVTLVAGQALSTADQAALDSTTGQVINVTAATVSITGANGVATTMTSTVTPTADNLNITFNPDETVRAFTDRVTGTTNYEATVIGATNADTTLMKDFDFGTRATGVEVRFDEQISPDDFGSFRQDLKDLIDWFNNNSTLVSAVRASAGSQEGSELPDVTGGTSGVVRDVAIFMTGGTRGTSTNSDWQAGFDAILDVRANQVAPLISQDLVNEGNGSTATFASVAAQLLAHVQAARGSAQTERGGYLGMKGTQTEIITQAQSLNDTDIELIPQTIQTLNAAGTLTTFDEWAAAVTAAGMRSGAPEIGEPLTFKLLKTTAITNDASWSPENDTDRNLFIQNGVMFIEPAPNGGFRWVRDLTTHLQNDNIAFIDGNTRDAVRFVAFDLRTFIEETFTGVKATPATVASIREQTAAKLRTYVNDNILVESLDPENPADTTTLIPGFRRLRVSISGNTATIKVEIFPVTGVVFQINEIFLQLPTLSTL